MKDAPYISLVVPMYNEEEVISEFFDRVVPILDQFSSRYEIVCVNDGSRDATLAMLVGASQDNDSIKVIDLSRNFGKERALTAGLDFASGDVVVPIDADLQDPPELIGDMLEKWREGADMVIAVRTDRGTDSWLKRVSSESFYRIAARLSETPLPFNAGDFRLMDRRVVEALKRLPERTRFMKGLFAWLGYRQAQVEYTRPERVSGTTKWSFWKLWNLALEGIVSFSTLPLRIWTYFGFGVAIVGALYALIVILRTVFLGVDVPGYASLMVVLLFFSGLNMVGLGVLGEYVGRVFLETKERPVYLVREAIGFDGTAKGNRQE
ncbi:MAG: glycosyltransferase family 2 protein [Pseudomonadota bacterium]